MRFLALLLVLATLLSFTACMNTENPPIETDPSDTSENDTSADDTSAEDTSEPETEEVKKTMEELMVESLLSACEKEITYKEYPEFNPTGAYAGIKAITYTGADIGDNKTKVFAYIGFPEGASAENKVPAIVLVHGSQSGVPYAAWVKEWNDRGYAAICMSTNNFFPKNNIAGDREYNGELENWNIGLYGVFEEDGYVSAPRNDGMNDSAKLFPLQWMYHAISAVIHANSLLRADERVDSEKVGISGVSWGGVVTSLVIGYDTRFAFAIPIYGSGYLTESHTVFADLFSKGRNPQYWLAEARFDYADMPILWLCMNNDAPFSLNTNVKSYLHTLPNNEETRLAAISGWGHSHVSGWGRPESYVFADSICKDGAKMPALLVEDGQPIIENPSDVAIDTVKIYYLKSEYAYTDGKAPTWLTEQVKYNNGNMRVTIPEDAKVYYYEISYKINGKTCYTTSEMIEVE